MKIKYDTEVRRKVKKIICTKCGVNEAQEGTDPAMCTQCMANKGGGNDCETDKEMAAMEARDANEDEGDK